MDPNMVTVSLPVNQCGDVMKVSDGVIVLACPSTKWLTIFRRRTLKIIYDRQFTQNKFYGEEMQLISHMDGKQTYIFYTIRQASQNKIGLLEVLINEKLEKLEDLEDNESDPSHYVIDYGELLIPYSDAQNYGLIHLGGGDGKLLTFFDTFTKIKGYNMCGYKETLSDRGSPNCSILPNNTYSLNPFKLDYTSCGQKQSNPIDEQKLDFICNMEKAEVDLTRIILLTIMVASQVFCCISTILFCLNKQASAEQQANVRLMLQTRRIDDPAERARLEEEQKKMRIERLQKLLKKLKYGSRKSTGEAEACCICVEDFTKDSVVRETPCNHVFHDDCLMKWVETKLAAPDCPFCRAEIKYNAN